MKNRMLGITIFSSPVHRIYIDEPPLLFKFFGTSINNSSLAVLATKNFSFQYHIFINHHFKLKLNK